ncbi:MAG TPA: MMPL family transporter [Mycobacteriales bacterium]|nr:MMPL family transporter [Mycobacteriales bacterium]
MADTAAPPTDRRGAPPPAAGRFARLGGWAYRRRRLAVALWIAVLAAVTAGAQAAGSAWQNDFSLPGTESQRALDLLAERAPEAAGASAQVVFQAPAGLAGRRAEVGAVLARVRELPRVTGVRGPYDDPAAVSADGTIGYATVSLDAPAEQLPAEDVRALVDTARAGAGPGLTVEVGGEPVRGAAEEEGGGAAEGAGLLAALVIMVLLFGSLLAAALPLLVAVFAVGSALGLITLASHAATVADFTAPLMLLVGLGVGIDYALLVFARYRGELLAGADREQAARTALDTAGRTVVVAGSTVIVALLGLVALGLGSLQGVAVAIALTVLVTMAAAVTLLPALLAVLGRRIERAVRRRAGRAARRGHAAGARWRRWATAVQRRPVLATVVPALLLLLLSAPALGLRLGFADAGNDPGTSGRAYDLLAEGFGPGVNGPLVVVAAGGDAAGTAAAARPVLAGTAGVAGVQGPFPAGDPGVLTLLVVPATGPQDAATAALVDRLRADVLPPLATGGTELLVGGPTAAARDFSAAVAGRLPLFVGIVVGLSALLLLAVFRSLLIPVKAAVLNLLGIGASLGVVTLVFQHGWLGVAPGPIEAYVPVMVFAIVFGLSMDYEVFLLSRMHEEWVRHRDAPRAVREGLATTGQVVTAAAAIMVVVFGAFLLSPDRMLRQFGLGLSVAVLLDAVVIRCLLVPAVMQLLGRRAWALPAPLGRLLPRVALEPRR